MTRDYLTQTSYLRSTAFLATSLLPSPSARSRRVDRSERLPEILQEQRAHS